MTDVGTQDPEGRELPPTPITPHIDKHLWAVEGDYRPGESESIDENIREVKSLIRADLLSLLPEKYDMDYVTERNIGGTSIHIAEGHNQAIDLITKAIERYVE